MNIRKPKSALKFKKPGGWWGALYREALPLGNGLLGAAVYGGACRDTVMLTHGDLWWQGHVNVLPDVADKIKDVKKAMEENRPRDGEQILANALIAKGYRPQLAYPLPLADFNITMPAEKAVKEYMRVLNMENGEASVTYKDGATRFERSMFVSRAHDMVAMEITKSGAKTINVSFSMDVHDKTNNRTPSGISKTPEGVTVKYEPFFIYYSARSDNGTEFGAVAHIKHYGGSMDVKQDEIEIRGADRVLVLIKPFIENQREKEWKKLKGELAGIKLTYDKLLKEHAALHSKLFNSAELELEDTGRDKYIEDLIDEAREGGVSQTLLEKMWAFGRYLTVSATGGTGRPIAPYGLWCGDYKGYHSTLRFDGAFQAMYSHIFGGNLTELFPVVFNMFDGVLDDLKKNSARLFGTRGIMVPTLIAPGSGLIGAVEPRILHNTSNAAQIAVMFYDYYLYTGDMKFLKNQALPFMKEAALFYEEFLKIGPEGHYYTSPSYSPDNSPANYSAYGGQGPDIVRSATVDFSVAKALLNAVIAASEAANMYKPDIPKWKEMLTKIPAYPVNGDGAVSEYIEEKNLDNYSAATMAHLYPAYPGTEISGTDSEAARPFMNAAKKKAAASIGTATVGSWLRLANTFLRLGDSDTAVELINNVVKGCVMDNLVTAENDWRGMGLGNNDPWASYNIEGNLALTNAVQEMLVQSDESTIKILPALPEFLKKGMVEGLLTRTGAEVSIDWDVKKGTVSLKIKAKRANKVKLVLPAGTKRYKGPMSEKFNAEACCVENLELPAGKALVFDIKW